MLAGCATYFITANDILRQARDLLTAGKKRDSRGTISHPPLQKRLRLIEQLYKAEFDDASDIYTSYDSVDNLATVLQILWKHTQTNTKKLYERGKKLTRTLEQ